jgi:hypothetical protein
MPGDETAKVWIAWPSTSTLETIGSSTVGRQVAADAVDRVLGVLYGLFRRHFHAEHDDGLRLAVGDRRLDLVDAGDAGDGVFDLLRHLHFELGRRRAALCHAIETSGTSMFGKRVIGSLLKA